MNGRLYDPALHRFLAPDNYIQDPFNTQNFNRYGYVLNNPLMYTDPSGEFIFAALIGAAIGVITNGINNSIHNRGFFEGAGKAALFGAIGGAASFGIGQIANNIASSFGSGVFQATAHFYTGGFLSVAQGGDFLSGGLAGGISSGIGTFTGGLLKNVGKFWQGVGIVGSGSISGGIGSRLAGGNFWDGFRQGAISSGLNHFAHKIAQVDPLKKYRDRAITLEKWKEIYQDKSWYEIITEGGWKQGQPLGPKSRYVINPIDGNVMDMRHVAVIGYGYGESVGNIVEHIQNLHSTTRPSAFDPQDYYSNKVGAYFYQLRHSGSWASSSWSYDFTRFIQTQYKGLFKNYKP